MILEEKIPRNTRHYGIPAISCGTLCTFASFDPCWWVGCRGLRRGTRLRPKPGRRVVWSVAGWHGVRNDPDALGRRVVRNCGRAGATPASEPSLFPTIGGKPSKQANGHDFAQHSVIRRRTSVSEVVPGWKGPFREGPNRSGTATDYGCCVMAMEAGGVKARTL
jgi:hypothetical protein